MASAQDWRAARHSTHGAAQRHSMCLADAPGPFENKELKVYVKHGSKTYKNSTKSSR